MRQYILPVLAFGLLGLAAPDANSQQEFSVADGPIEIRDQHPLSILHMTFRPEDASIPTPGTTRIGVNGHWSNTFNYKPENFRVDTETRVGDFFLRYGLTPGLELQFSQNVIWRGSGETDGLIRSFHKTFNISSASSDEVKHDQYVISGVNKDGSTWELNHDGLGLSGLETALKYSPSDQSAEERWAVLCGVGLPTGTPEFGQNGLDLQLALYGQAAIDRLAFYAGAAILYFTDTEINNLSFPSFQYAGFVGTLFPLLGRVSAYGGAHLASILLEDVEGYPDYQTYVDFGLRTRMSDTVVFDIAGRENVLHSQGTTDFTVSLGITYQARP